MAKKNYLNNADMLKEIQKSRCEEKMTDTLARMLMLLTERYGRQGKYIGYTFNDDMRAYAMMHLVRTWDRFDDTKYDNPFAYYTMCIHNSFNQFLNKEKRQRDIRDSLLVDAGLEPSYNYQIDQRNAVVEEAKSREEELDFFE